MTKGLLAVAATAGLLSVAPLHAAPAGNPAATLVYFDGAANATFDPVEPQSNSSVAQAALMAAYDSLVRLTDAGEPVPGLAQSWSYNDDLTEFTLTLRPNVKFHDGSAMTPAVLARNLERSIALGPRAGAATVETMGQIAAVEALDASRVRLKLKQPNGQMPYLLAGQPGMMIGAAALTDAAFGATLKPIGAGPYRVRNFEASVRTSFERFNDYWGGGEGRPAAIEHHFVPDSRARLNAVRSGQAHLALIDPRQIPEAKSAGLTVQVNQKNTISTLYINADRDNIGNLKVRQAFMHALDRPALAEALGGGVAQPTAQLFASISPFHDKALENIYPFDQTRARKLLAEAGYKEGVDVTWILLNASEYRLIGEAIQAMVAEVGIRIKFETVDISQYQVFRRPPTRGDIMLGRWGGRADPLQTFQEIAGLGGSVNGGRAATPEIDTLIDKARRLDPADPKRARILHDLARLTTEQVSHIAVMTRPSTYAYRPGCILNLTPYLPTGSDRFNDVQLAAECK
jgi:peptide/nickel transport system substrate-binding protein